MKYIRVFTGLGASEIGTSVLIRVLKKYVNENIYKVQCISPEEIVQGTLSNDTALLAIGGGYDMGLIKSLGHVGMNNIKTYVQSGGSYLGICSGAYFACGRIEFDKDGPLQVVGERFLKFFPGCGIGPLFKPYDYASKKGASAVEVDFTDPKQTETTPHGDTNQTQNKFQCKTYFNGGLYFNEKEDIDLNNVVVLSRYLNLPGHPAAMVLCKVGSGKAILGGPHFEYESEDLEGDPNVTDIIPFLKDSAPYRRNMMTSVLNCLNIVTTSVHNFGKL